MTLEQMLVELISKLEQLIAIQRQQSNLILKLQTSVLAIASEAGMVEEVIAIMEAPNAMTAKP